MGEAKWVIPPFETTALIQKLRFELDGWSRTENLGSSGGLFILVGLWQGEDGKATTKG